MFDKKLIFFSDTQYTDKTDCLSDLANKDNPYIIDHFQYCKDVLNREEIVPTAIGYGIAIPHAISLGVKQAFVAVEKLTTPIEWTEGEKVSLILMIGVPKNENSGNQHLKILAALSKNLMHASFRDALSQAESTEEMYEKLKKIEEEMNKK